MTGTERIVARIQDEARAKAAEALRAADEEAERIEAEGRSAADAEFARLCREAEAQSELAQTRLRSAAESAQRRKILAAKQELVDAAFARAGELLHALAGGEKIELLATLAARAGADGGELIFNAHDRAECGAEVTAAANRMRGRGAAPLTLSAETREISGGVIAVSGRIETNCSFEALLHWRRDSLAGEVARILFD